MWAQAGIISANHHRGWRERNPRAVRCTPNVTLNPVRHLSCQWRSRMKMLQHQRFYDVLNCEGHNTTLAILLNELPSYRWISLAFMPLLGKILSRYAQQGTNADRGVLTLSCSRSVYSCISKETRIAEHSATRRLCTLSAVNEAWNQRKL